MYNTNGSGLDYGIVVHCHLRWNFVWQRPQHILSRLSQHHPVLFMEPWAHLPAGETEPRMEVEAVSGSLSVARPLLARYTSDPASVARVDAANYRCWRDGLSELVRQRAWPDLVHWFYDPTAVEARHLFSPAAVAYDCMDELANFRGAPREIREREEALMAAADVVFTGGPSLYQARKGRHPNVHQFNSGVDVGHFRRALDPGTAVPGDVAGLPRPLLLYYGVIDERMGWDNLAAVADAHPEWSVALVGPLAKIGEADLLRRPNVLYLGQRGYAELPGYLKGCDAALVPFALSEATRFLSPTKTLEYFAARRPVVSTPIPDIVAHYADAARVAATPAEFVAACEAALADTAGNRARLERGEAHAAAQTWDRIVEGMRRLLDEAVAKILAQR